MKELDGHQLFGFFNEGARTLSAQRAELDRINVFPVPDGDTGSNMAMTINYAVESAQASDSAALTLNSLAQSALVGARGNSGVIFAQFIFGLAESMGEETMLDMARFAKAVSQAHASARQAVRVPREGTMLSVIRDWAEALHREHTKSTNFLELFRTTRLDLLESLEATTNQLEELRAAGVVDAGASGFVAFVEGGSAYLEAGARRDLSTSRAAADVPAPVVEEIAWGLGEDPRKGRRYCSEFFILPRDLDLDAEAMRTALEGMGDSLIVAGGRMGARIHLHTDEPARVMDLALGWGRVREQKVDDMYRLYEDARLKHGSIALVTDSACDLPREILDRYQIHVIPLTIRFGEDEFLDRLTLDPQTLYDRIEASQAFPSSSQPSPTALERFYCGLLAHYDRVVALHVSGKLSGTFEASRRAAEKLELNRISVVDTKHLSGSLGLMVLRAAQLLESGMGINELLSTMPALSAGASILVSVRTLESMVRGGRVSPLGGWLGKVLNLKPIVSVDGEGASKLYGAALSVASNVRKIVGMMAKRHAHAPIRSWAVIHGANEAGARDLAARMEALLGFPPEHISSISAVIGINSGRGAVAVVSLSY